MTVKRRHPFTCVRKGIVVRRSTARVMLLALIMAGTSPRAEVVTEATIGSGYQSNLFNDSSAAADLSTSAGLNLKYFPSASTRLTAGAQYNAFTEYSDLSNLTGDLSLTVIPTAESSRLSLALAGAVAVRQFGSRYELYDRIGATAGADLTFRLLPSIHLLTAASYLSNSYTNSDIGSYRSYDLAGGANLRFAGSNTLALRAEFDHRIYEQPSPATFGPGNRFTESGDNTQSFDIMSGLIRFSRPLGSRTGLNLSASHRRLDLPADYTFYGYTIDYLSPWSDLWEGSSFSAGLKHFFPNQITTEFAIAYADKDFVDVVEQADDGTEYLQNARNDRQTSLSLAVTRPLVLKSGQLLTPSLVIGYRDNNSTEPYFDHEAVSASLSLKIQL